MSRDSHETTRIDASKIRFGPLAPGMVLSDRYRLDGELGRGGMGVVFRATDLELEREVAVKVLPETVTDPQARERLLGEARAAAALNHPHVVSVYDVGEDQGTAYFIMELVEGPSLGAAPPTDLEDIVAVARQICDALDHAHGHGLVHRDLKPDNVLFVGEHEPRIAKVADLGLAVPMRGSRLSETGMVTGTAAYMAPEQALGAAVDGRADLYALGVVLYQLTTGRLPFTGDDPLAVISQHVHAPVVPPRALRADLPPVFETLILRLLAKDPAQRYGTARETSSALEGALDPRAAAAATETGDAVAILEALSRGRLVGRRDELGEARDLWRRALAGQGHCVLISGEPGAGKTRLAREVQIQAALDGAAVLSGGCYEYEATTPYLPFVEAFRRWVRGQDEAALRETLGDAAPHLSRLAPELETRLGPFPARPELPPHEERLLFFDAVAQALRELARRRGLFFYVDDLHWADGSTLWLLAHLLRSLREERVLLVASYRETELDRAHPLAKALVDWNRERLSTRIALRRFGPEETRAQLSALLGEDVSVEFAGAIFAETEGNPFFVEEVLKALIDQGSVRRDEGKWERCEITDLAIPQSVKAAIGNRLDRTSPECNEMLRAAAVLGKTFEFEELAAAAGDKGEDFLLDALDEAVAAQLLVADRDESFAFTHDKIREVLYEEMNPIRRRRLHRRTAEGLERLREKGRVAVETLAHHTIEAGDYERGLGYAQEAAREAQSVYAYDEAMMAYSRALECAEALDRPDERLDLEEAMGMAGLLSGEPISAIKHFERALLLTDDPARRIHLQCQAASTYVTTGDPKGLDYVREALELLDPETDPVNTAVALSTEARFHHLSGRHRKAREILMKAVELIEPPDDDTPISTLHASTLSTCYGYLAGTHQHLGLFRDADEWAWKAVRFGRARAFPLAEAMGYEFLGENSIGTGTWEKGIEYALTEREIAERVSSRERRGWTHLVIGLCAGFLEDFDRADREYADGIALAEAIGEHRLASLLFTYRAVLQAESGRLDVAMETAREALERAEAIDLLYMRTEARRCLAHVHFKRGEFSESLVRIEDAMQMTEDSEGRATRIWMGPVHVETLLALDRKDEARKQFDAYAALIAEVQSPYFASEVKRLRELVGGS